MGTSVSPSVVILAGSRDGHAFSGALRALGILLHSCLPPQLGL